MSKAGKIMYEAVMQGSAEVTRMAIFDLYRLLTTYTPVATGRARAGWILAEGSPSTTVPAPGQYGPPDPPAISIHMGQEYFITNNVVYIVPLDNGHSDKAPAGMTDRAVNEVTRKYS